MARILEEMGLEVCGTHGTTAALALLNDAVKKGGVMASNHVGGLSGAFIPVSEDEGMIAAAQQGALGLDKLEAMTCVCSVGLDMIAVPGDTSAETLSAIIADEAAIGMVNSKTTAVRLIPAPGKKVGDTVEFGGLLGSAPVIPVHPFSSAPFIQRGGRHSGPHAESEKLSSDGTSRLYQEVFDLLQFDVTHALPFLPENWLSSRLDGLTEARNLLERGNGLGGAFTGWVDLPASYDPEELQRILQTARIIRGQSEVLIVIGIGGSYLGARAMLELLTSPNYNLLRKKTPQIFFTGNTLSSDALTELLDYVRDKDFSVNVISKSGDTTESSIAFFLFRRLLEEKYGREGARDRIFATTDRREGTLRALANQAGYATFSVPASIGGRYSVLTAAGLLPLAVAGLDIQEMLAGSARRHGGAAPARPGQPRLAVRRRPQRPVRGGQAH